MWIVDSEKLQERERNYKLYPKKLSKNANDCTLELCFIPRYIRPDKDESWAETPVVRPVFFKHKTGGCDFVKSFYQW